MKKRFSRQHYVRKALIIFHTRMRLTNHHKLPKGLFVAKKKIDENREKEVRTEEKEVRKLSWDV